MWLTCSILSQSHSLIQLKFPAMLFKPSTTTTMFISNNHPLLSLLPSLTSLPQIKQTHAQFLTHGLFLHPFPPSKLLSLLLSLSPPLLPYAHLLFIHSPSPPIFSYNTLIKAHSSSPPSLLLFRSLLRSGPAPNRYTLTFVLSANGLGREEVEQVRGQALRRGFEGNLFVGNVLVRVYGGLGMAGDARKVFDGMGERDFYSWNSMVGGYVGVGDVGRAREVFDEMPERDVVSWSTMIAGCAQAGCFVEAMELFREMLISGPPPNEFTLTTVLAACANLVALDQGRWVHTYINKARIKMNDRLLASLIDMYSKCGELELASRIFNDNNDTKNDSVRPWNAMLTGFAIHGQSDRAIQLFERMKDESIAPNEVTFVSLLSACSHGRLVHQGQFYFESMKKIYGIDPKLEHYGCMVDLLGRAGLLEEAEEIISTMPMDPDTAIWGSLLSACRIHRDVERGARIGKFLDPKNIGCHVLLANLYSKSERWEDAKYVRKSIEASGGRKTPGCSSIELDGSFHQFLVGDRSHPQTKEINSFLDEMAIKLKNAGYVPEVGEVLLDINEEDRETALSRHSEKLAIAFGIMNTPPGTVIRIVKNLRVCLDCHEATKFISRVYDREIVVRDRIRFHHFKDGICSCNDYW